MTCASQKLTQTAGACGARSMHNGGKKGQEGGSFIGNVADLAVPFGLVLAQRGLSYMMSKKDPVKSKPAKKTASKAAAPKKKTQKGGAETCLLCNSAAQHATHTGGRNARQQAIGTEYMRLARELQSLLEAA